MTDTEYKSGPLPEPEWAHLRRYGYAPGHYMNKCHKCERVVADVDKRAYICRPCAESLHDVWGKPPALKG